MFKKETQKTIFIIIIVLLIVGMMLPFFTRLWN